MLRVNGSLIACDYHPIKCLTLFTGRHSHPSHFQTPPRLPPQRGERGECLGALAPPIATWTRAAWGGYAVVEGLSWALGLGEGGAVVGLGRSGQGWVTSADGGRTWAGTAGAAGLTKSVVELPRGPLDAPLQEDLQQGWTGGYRSFHFENRGFI